MSDRDELDLSSEQRNDCADLVKKLREGRDHRLKLPLTKLPERYVRGDYAIVFHCLSGDGVLGHGKFALIIQCDFCGNLRHRCREMDKGAGIYDDKLPVLVESIHVVDDEKKIVYNIGPSIVRLQFFDQAPDAWMRNSLYFSFVSFNLLFVDGLNLKHGEFNDILGLKPSFVAGEVPNNVVETGSQMVNNLPREYTESQRDELISMIINRLLPSLVIYMGNDWIFPALKKGPDFDIEVKDVLIGPF